MKTQHLIAFFAAVAFLQMACGISNAQVATNGAAILPKSESPDKSLALSARQTSGHKIDTLYLVSLKGNFAAVPFPLSPTVRSWDFRQIQFSSIIWTEDNSAVALMIGNGTNGEVYACAKLTNGAFKAHDLTSLSQGAHLGNLGRSENDFVRSEHTPVRWGEWTAHYGRIIEIQSRFWDKTRKHYARNSPFLITNSGRLEGQ